MGNPKAFTKALLKGRPDQATKIAIKDTKNVWGLGGTSPDTTEEARERAALMDLANLRRQRVIRRQQMV